MKKWMAVWMAAILLAAASACAAKGPPPPGPQREMSAGSQVPQTPGPAVPAAQEESPADGAFPAHQPYGEGTGAMPGRVVWAHDPGAVAWDGEGYWWEPGNFDQAAVQKMVDAGIASLGGKEGAREGWAALFAASKKARGQSGGYAAGEKIAVKANINGSAVFSDDTSGETALSYTNPVLLKALLTSLVREAGAAPADITVYDVSRLFPEYMVALCTEGELRGVNFVDRRNAVADENAPIHWSHDFGGAINHLPACVTQADYVVNLANLKGHSYGITLCGKNHFGSFLNGNAMRPPQEANLHQWLTKSEMGIYSPLVDLMANAYLGGKTVLYLLDALICAPSEGAAITGENARWQQPPFNGGYTSSIFVSQDPVAIDSVGADFLINEPAVTQTNGAAKDVSNENYLHEAGLVASAPSGTVYTDGRGNVVGNLGVHEHWNNPADKQYSRNLGKAQGIELVKTGPGGGAEAGEAAAGGGVLVAYFSRSGNTQAIAQMIAQQTGGDLFGIQPATPYPDDYDAVLERAAAEKEEGARPPLAESVNNMADYRVVFVGYPIWLGDAPMAVLAFLESHDLSGKAVVPFCTSGGSAPQASYQSVESALPGGAALHDGFWASGAQAAHAQEAVGQWLEGLKLE